MASQAKTEKSAGTMSAEQAREEAAYTSGVQAYLWGVPIVEYGKTGVVGLKARAVALNSFRKYPTLKTHARRVNLPLQPKFVTERCFSAIFA